MESMNMDKARSHQPLLVRLADIDQKVHGGGFWGRLNTFLAVKITSSVGSMWCAYLFAALACVSLPSAIRSGNPVIIVSWISQTFLQLVLLSVIMVGQNVASAASDARAEADHETLTSAHQMEIGIQDLLKRNTDLTEQIHDLSEQIKSSVVRS